MQILQKRDKRSVGLMELIDRVKYWFQNLMPDVLVKTMKKDRKEANLEEAMMNIFLSYVPLSALIFLLFVLIAVLGGEGEGRGISLIIGIVIGLLIPVLAVLDFILSHGLLWLVAKALGGTGEYKKQAFFASLPTSAIYLLSVILIFIFVIPCIGLILILIITIYFTYMHFLVVREIHKLDNVKAAAVTLSPYIIFGLVLVIIFAILFGLMML
jgi:hypothetical protein